MGKDISIAFYISLLVGFPVTHLVAVPRYDLNPSKESSHLAKRDNFTRIESSVKNIEQIGQLLATCPYILKRNEVQNRVPSMFYEMECQTCNKCGKNGLKCTQLTSEIEAFYFEDDENLWTEPLKIKSGCACVTSLQPSSANIRP